MHEVMAMSKIAIASIDNEEVDEHFGHAYYFQIYEVNSKGHFFIETRNNFNNHIGHSEKALEAAYEKLKDCAAVFTERIGEGAAAYMLSKNIRVFEARGSVGDLLEQVVLSGIFA